MGLSWNLYTGLYYGFQIGSFFIILLFLTILIPYDLIDWILKTMFFMEDVEKNKDKHTQTIITAVKSTDMETNVQVETEVNMKIKWVVDIDHEPDWCTCWKIWQWFGNVFTYACCQHAYVSGAASKSICDRLEEWYDRSCCCDNEVRDLKNKKLPHKHEVKLERRYAQWCCGFIKLNTNKISVYLLLCTNVWCAFIAFFEAVILSYTPVGKGDNCPIPTKATSATIVDCFGYQNSFDSTPTNKTFPSQCNGTMPLVFSGDWAGCFALIYADVEVVGVIEELGICSGIIAFIGTTVAIISYLCRIHRWRWFFDILAISAIVAIPILIRYEGNNPLLTYALLISLCISIIITEYLLHYVPLLTVLCLAREVFKRIKNCVKSNTQSRVTPSTENYHNSEA